MLAKVLGAQNCAAKKEGEPLIYMGLPLNVRNVGPYIVVEIISLFLYVFPHFQNTNFEKLTHGSWKGVGGKHWQPQQHKPQAPSIDDLKRKGAGFWAFRMTKATSKYQAASVNAMQVWV